VSWLVSPTTEGLGDGQGLELLPTEMGLVVMVVALLLVVYGELLRAAGPAHEVKPLRLNLFAVAPLMLAFVTILGVRLLERL
jgi:hypothetical protein